MQYAKILKETDTALIAVLLLSACTSSTLTAPNDYIYRNINFGPDRDGNFRQGVQDACRTADGDYIKDHNKFKNMPSYRVGWEDGRLKCKGKED